LNREIVLTQSPTQLSVSQGERVTSTCARCDILITQSPSSLSVSLEESETHHVSDKSGHLWILGKLPILLIYDASHRESVAIDLEQNVLSRSVASSLKMLQLITVKSTIISHP
ncbi:hypothetical protein U0070_005267, partial [Myodes glareolus]